MWSDNETSQDLLGFKVHADLIRSVVTDPKLLPVTLGVFGDWGSGKTSIMKMLEHDLNPDNYPSDSPEKEKYEKIAVLYFNGWLFEGYDDAKSALLSSILLQLGEHKRFGPKIKGKVARLLKSVNWMRVAKFGVKEIGVPAMTAFITGGASIVPSLMGSGKKIMDSILPTKDGEEVGEEGESKSKINWEEMIKEDKSEASAMDVRTFRQDFEKLLEETKIESLIVLIDDLDRCSNERIIENLEAIKLFLNVERTAFVIGADPRIVRHAIEVRYAQMKFKDERDPAEASERLVTDYLEKLIQIPYRLPKLSPAEVESYMSLLFCARDIEDGTLLGKVHKVCEDQRCANRYSVFGYAAVKEAFGETELPATLSESLIFSSNIAPLITEGLKGNPRQVKRFLNAYFLRKQLAKVAGLQSIRDDVLVKLMVLEYGHSKQFMDLFEWQAKQEGRSNELKQLEAVLAAPDGNIDNEEEAKRIDPQWSTSFVRRWVAMEPLLSEIDLRDYFWVARDKLSSTFSGVSMIPPLLRTILDDILTSNGGKRKPAVESASMLNTDDRIVLLNLIEKHIQRNPDQKNGYDALRALIEKNVVESIESLTRTLVFVPADSIPPAVGSDLIALQASNPSLKDNFEPAINHLKSTETRIARALRSSERRR
ncbi:P-loop NTPase fold protein [Paenibacillus polymyxa]|uniref:KAP family P-loop NTPase fold protein n=1 Tax=Paenibacillus polymyxa TaxID=1406 RepID=UPI002024E013|nr:P-loop NTPase fold protein [Paenibacillus polymyxa]URJ43656.1 P-loop NTPase fold protein [Paenibacillus polymyxa]